MTKNSPDNEILVNEDSFAGNSLMQAVRKNDIETARSILKNDASQVNEPESIFGQTPMHIAANGGNIAMIDLLHGHGSALNETDGFGNSPLHYAAGEGKKEAIAFLLDKEVEINKTNQSGLTALDAATIEENKEAALLLLKRGGMVLEENKESLAALAETTLKLSCDKDGVKKYGLEGKFEKKVGSGGVSMML